MVRIQLIPLLLAFLLAACAGNQPASPTYADDNDPYEGFNRKMFAVNMSLDRHILKPVAKGYLTVPQPVRASIRNFRNNLISPVTLSNDTVQGSWSRAGVSASRLLINTTVGVLGLFDPATAMGLPRHTEDFGQTLASWNVPQGSYHMVPVLGPRTTRSLGGTVVDFAMNPLSVFGTGDVMQTVNAAQMPVGAVSFRAQKYDAINDVKYHSLDPYARTRSVYYLSRQGLLEDRVSRGTASAVSEDEFDSLFEEEQN